MPQMRASILASAAFLILKIDGRFSDNTQLVMILIPARSLVFKNLPLITHGVNIAEN